MGSVDGSKVVQSEADHSPLSSGECRGVRAATDCRHSSWKITSTSLQRSVAQEYLLILHKRQVRCALTLKYIKF